MRPVDILFPEYKALKNEGYCPFCMAPIALVIFRDELSEREYQISGLCQNCQDEVFGMGDE